MKRLAAAIILAALGHGIPALSAPSGLINAVQRNAPEAVEAILESGADPDEWGVRGLFFLPEIFDGGALDGGTPLHVAISKGYHEISRLLLKYGADINAETKYGDTPLEIAIERGSLKSTRLLLENGAVIEPEAGTGPSALHLASRAGHTNIIGLLLAANAEINFKERNGATPLHRAVQEGHVEAARLLLDNGAYVNARGGWRGGTPLHYVPAVRVVDGKWDDSPVLVWLLLEYGADVHAKDSLGRTPLHYAALRKSPAVWVLIKAGAVINARDDSGATPGGLAGHDPSFHMGRLPQNETQEIFASFAHPPGPWSLMEIAVRGGDTATVRRLLEPKKKPTGKGGYGKTLLHRAAAAGYLPSIRILLDHGENVKTKDDSGWTALHWAASRNRTAAAALLLESGADVNSTNITGDTPMHLAATRDHAEAVRFFIDAGASLMPVNESGETPLHVGAAQGSANALPVLLRTDAAINAKDANGWTALHWAACGGHADVVRLLLDYGADAKAQDNDGITPLHWAARFSTWDNAWEGEGRFLTLRRLLSAGADVQAKDIDGLTPLHWIPARLSSFTFKAMFLLLAHGAEADEKIVLTQYNEKITLTQYQLQIAAKNGDVNFVRQLLSDGIDLDERDSWGWTALHWAAIRNHAKTARALLEHGADPLLVAGTSRNLSSWTRVQIWEQLELTAMDLAAAAGATEMVELLLAAPYPLAAETAVYHAARNGHAKTVRLFYDHGYEMKYVSDAVYGEHTDVVRFALGAGTEPGWLALHNATVRGHIEIARALINHGADVNGTWYYITANTPLHWAALNGDSDIAQLLIAAGSDISATNASGKTPLHLAALDGHGEVAGLLLDNGADIEARDDTERIDFWGRVWPGKTPLHVASYGWKRYQFTPLLIRRGALVTEPVINTSFRSSWRAYLEKQAKSPRLTINWGESIEIRQASGEEYSPDQLAKLELQTMGHDGLWHSLDPDAITWDSSLPMIRAVYEE